MLPQIILRKGKDDSLRRFHPWVFSGAISSDTSSLTEGELVEVMSHDGESLGVGHFQIGSIMVRMLSFEGQSFDEHDFFSCKLKEALRLRRTLGLDRPDNDSYRLVHGEGDFMPGLVVDVYGPTAVVQAHSPGMHHARKLVADILVDELDAGIKNVYYKSDTTLPFKANLEPQNEYLRGSFSGNMALENGLKFQVDWLKGQKTGFFLDQRDNRELLGKYVSNRKVLNMFCYTGGFSVYALAGGASIVHSVDSSAKAVMLTDSNVSINFPDDTRHKSYAQDGFKYLDNMEADAYDLIILDPPAFAKHRTAIKNALRGYQRINYRAFEKISRGGILFTFSCSQAVTKEQFRLAVFSAAAQAKRNVRILHQLTQPADHPINIYHPEGEYLKGLVLYVE